MEKGLIHLYCGDGKGKTTAAVGLSIRAAGNKKQVLFSQFMKDASSGEIGILQKLPGVKTLHGDIPKGFYTQMEDEQKAVFAMAQKKLLNQVIEEMTKLPKDSLIVLDEITYAYAWELIERDKLEGLLKNKPAGMEVVMTGRNPAQQLLDMADYITEMKCIRHPWEKKIAARAGIEF